MIEDALRMWVNTMSDQEPETKVYGVVTGTVMADPDPLGLGRLRVTSDFLDSLDGLTYARVATLMTGRQAGSYFIPSPGDTVLVAFEQGDVNAPYIIGSLWNATNPPPFPSPLTQQRVLRTPIGNQIGFREVPAAITITTPDMTQAASTLPSGITLATNTKITLQVGATKLELAPDGITLSAPSVTIKAARDFTVTAASGASISSSGTAALKAGGDLTIAGVTVKIN